MHIIGNLTLDLPAHAEAARTAPDALLEKYPAPVIIDEVQYAPSLLRHIKARIDADRSPGRYLLTGSQVFSLMQGVSESLAGRCGILNLHTLSRAELLAVGRDVDEQQTLYLGGYPELHVGADPDVWFPSYVATYLERDLRNLLRIADLPEFNRFLRACALIEPYFGNRTKRLIKAPKLVMRDTGLAAFLAGFRSAKDLAGSALIGAFWESYVFGEIARQAANRGDPAPIHYWRTAGGPEVDLVIERSAGALIAIECKRKEHPGASDAAGLHALEAARATA